MLDLHNLRLFITVVDEGSIAAAAARQHIAASALSKRLSELERSVGVSLLTRHARGVEATDAGNLLAIRGRALLREADAMALEVSDFAKGVRGYVRVSANASAITQFLPADLNAFRGQRPHIDIVLEERISTSVVRAVVENAADIGICVPLDNEVFRLGHHPYHRDRLVLIVPCRHPLAERDRVAFADTLEHDYVGMQRGSSLNLLLTLAANHVRRPLRLRLQASSFDAMVAMVSAGLGIGVLPSKAARTLYRSDGLKLLDLQDEWATRQLMLCVRDHSSLSPAAALLLAHLRAQVVDP